jgi:hypothetical protein
VNTSSNLGGAPGSARGLRNDQHHLPTINTNAGTNGNRTREASAQNAADHAPAPAVRGQGDALPERTLTTGAKQAVIAGDQPAAAAALHSSSSNTADHRATKRHMNDTKRNKSESVSSSSECAVDESEGKTNNQPSDATIGRGLAAHCMPTNASAVEGDPVYRLTRNIIPEWPVKLSPKAKLQELTYTGGGWPILFLNPKDRKAVVNHQDLQLVAEYLRTNHGLAYHSCSPSSAGTVQLTFGRPGADRGNVQLFVTRHGLSWNARINGSEMWVKEIRGAIFKSSWFQDGLGNEPGKANVLVQPEGLMILPALALTDNESIKPLEEVLKTVFQRLGAPAAKAMKMYIKRSYLTDKSTIKDLLKKHCDDALERTSDHHKEAKGKAKGRKH